MIIPIVCEREWETILADLPPWDPPHVPTVVVSPHPDDETLGAGGLIERLCRAGVEVTVVAVTDGENAYRDAAGIAEPGQAATREIEQTCALAKLGVDRDRIIRLRLPDSGLSDRVEPIAAGLRSIVGPRTHVIAPWVGDFHPDHVACAQAAKQAATAAGARLTSYFFWTWHRGTKDVFNGLPVVRFNLTPDEMRAKSTALGCHGSQLQHASGQPILPPNLLGPARRCYEVFLPHA